MSNYTSGTWISGSICDHFHALWSDLNRWLQRRTLGIRISSPSPEPIGFLRQELTLLLLSEPWHHPSGLEKIIIIAFSKKKKNTHTTTRDVTYSNKRRFRIVVCFIARLFRMLTLNMTSQTTSIVDGIRAMRALEIGFDPVQRLMISEGLPCCAPKVANRTK